MRDPAARRVGVACAVVCLAMAVAAPVLARGLAGAPGVPYTPFKPLDPLVPTACAVIGAALIWLRTRNAVGWILLAIGTCGTAGVVLGVYGIRAYVFPSEGLPAPEVAL